MTARDIQSCPTAGDLLAVTAAFADDHGAVVVLRVLGEVDLSTVGSLRQHLTDHLTTGCRGLVLDFTGVTFLAGCGLGILAEATEWARGNGVALRLVVGGARSVLRPLEVTGLAEVITQADSVDDAVLLCSR